MRFLLTILLFISFSASAQYFGMDSVDMGNGWKMLVHRPADTTGGKRFPALLYMGGNGEVGNNVSIMFNNGPARQFSISARAALMPDSIFYFCILNSSNASSMRQPNNAAYVMDYITAHYKTDTTNWMLAGISQGAINVFDLRGWANPPDATWSFGGDGTNYRLNRFRLFAAASPCSPMNGIVWSRFSGKGFRLYHALDDGTCSVNFTYQDSLGLRTNGAYGIVKLFATGGHSNTVWDSLFSPYPTDSTNNVYLWLMKKSPAPPPSNIPPTANAGADQSLGVGTTSTTLNGSGSFDSDGSISSYSWTRVSGPNTPTIVSPTSVSTSVTGMVAGTYVFQLTVTDNLGATGSDNIQVTIASGGTKVLAGYVKQSSGSFQACNESSGVTIPLYTDDGTIANNKITYTDNTGTHRFNGQYNWYAFSTASGGTVSQAFQIWGDSTDASIKNLTSCSGGGSGGSSAGFSPLPGVAKGWKRLTPIVYIDLSRYWINGAGGNSPLKWFDSIDTTTAIPFRHPDDFFPKGQDPNTKIVWNGSRGLRMIWDLVGDSNINDLSKRYSFNDTLWGWDKTSNIRAKVYLYNWDSVLNNIAWYNRWLYAARPDSMMSPFATLQMNNGASTGGVWQKSAVSSTTCRYVLVRCVSDTITAFGQTFTEYPTFGEIAMYGTPNFTDSTTIKRFQDYDPKVKRKFGQFIGLNIGGNYFRDVLKYRFNTRWYAWNVAAWDPQNIATGSQIYDADPYNNGTSILRVWDSLANYDGMRPWLSIAGGNNYFAAQTGAASVAKTPNLDGPNLEPSNPANYQRSADFFKNFGAKYGRNTGGYTEGALRWNTDYPGLGKHFFDYVENGNEEKGRTGLDPLSYFMKSQMDYDGYAGRFANTGLKSGDSMMKLIMAGNILIDTNLTKAYVYLSHFLRPDSFFIWQGGVNDHYYDRTINNLVDFEPLSEQLDGVKGATAEADSVRTKLTSARKGHYKYLRQNIPYFLSEFGYDNYSKANVGIWNTFNTIGGTPIYTGFDSVQSKAIAIEHHNVESFVSGISGTVEFLSENASYDTTNNNPGLFATSGEFSGSANRPKIIWPVYWVKNYQSQLLYNYDTTAGTVIVGTGNIRVYKLRNVVSTDSVCYYVAYVGLDGGTQNYTLSVGSTTSTNATKAFLNFTNTSPTTSATPIVGGNISVVAQARAQYFFVKELNGNPINDIHLKKFGGKRHFGN